MMGIKKPIRSAYGRNTVLMLKLSTVNIHIIARKTKLSKNFFLNSLQIYCYFSKNKQENTKK